MPIDLTNPTTAAAEDGVAVEDQMPRRGIEGEGFSQLLDDPGGARVEGGVEVKDPSSVMVDDEPAVQDTQRGGRDREEVHRRDALLVVAQEAQPALDDIWICRPSRHVPGDGRLRDGEAQLRQFTVNSRSSPVVFQSHPVDQLADLPVHSRPPWATLVSGELGPIASKTLAMPLHNGLWLHDD